MLKRVTVPRRIMLLLYDNMRYADSYEVPELMTQAGISNELNLRQTHISRALSEMRSEKFIFERSSHIIGAARKKKAYFLTQKGLSDVRAFLEETLAKKVLVHTTEGELREYTVDRVQKEVKEKLGYTLTLHQLLNLAPNVNEIDLNELKARSGAEQKRYRKLNIPVPRHFFGRKKERDMILGGIRDDMYRFVIINSIAGQGKTALLINISTEINDRPVIWTALNEWYKLSNLFNDWAYFLKEHGKRSFFNYLGKSSKLNMQDALRAFIKDTRDLRPVFIIDDFHKAHGEINEMFVMLKAMLAKEKDIVFLISSRKRPTFYGRKDVHQSKLVLELDLLGLDRNSAFRILNEKGIPRSEFQNAYQITRGHPLALELYSPALFSEGEIPNLEFEAFLGEEVIRNLGATELEVVKLASLFQRPVSRSAFFFKPAINQDTIDELCNKLILRSYQGGTYDTHDLIKSYFANRFSEFEKRTYLDIAIDYYSDRGSERDILEYLRLLKEAGESERLRTALLEHGDFLLSQGYTQIGEYIQDMDDADLDTAERIRLSILRSDFAFANGNTGAARSYLEKGLRTCEKQLQVKDRGTDSEEIVRLLSRIYNRSAEISKLEGGLDETIRSYKEIVELNKRYGNMSEVGKALNNLALAHRERGELELALSYLNKARDVFQELTDQNALALVEVNMGDIYLLKRDLRGADRHFKAAEDATLKYPQVSGLIHGKLGRSRMKMGKPALAEASLIESLAAYRKTNDVYNQIRNLNDLFKCAFKQKNRTGSQNYLNETSLLLNENFKEHKSSELWVGLRNDHLKNHLVYAARFRPKQLEKQLDEYVISHKQDPDPKLILEDMDQLESDLGGNREIMNRLFSELTAIFSTVEDKHPLVIINIRHAKLLKAMGRSKEARALLKKARPVAERLGFKKGLGRIDEMLSGS